MGMSKGFLSLAVFCPSTDAESMQIEPNRKLDQPNFIGRNWGELVALPYWIALLTGRSA
jgi:hypothetical protein